MSGDAICLLFLCTGLGGWLQAYFDLQRRLWLQRQKENWSLLTQRFLWQLL